MSNEMNVLSALANVMSAVKYESPEIKKTEGGLTFVWDKDDYFLEVVPFECGDADCACFQWFFVGDQFQRGTSSLECADNISEAFMKVLMRNVKVPDQ